MSNPYLFTQGQVNPSRTTLNFAPMNGLAAGSYALAQVYNYPVILTYLTWQANQNVTGVTSVQLVTASGYQLTNAIAVASLTAGKQQPVLLTQPITLNPGDTIEAVLVGGPCTGGMIGVFALCWPSVDQAELA